jgi:hypothetical protein
MGKIVIDRSLEEVEIRNYFEEMYVEIEDIIVKDIIDSIEKIVSFYDRASKFEVAFKFSVMLMKESMIIYDNYKNYFNSRDVNEWKINGIVGRRVECYVKKL